jgi:hypothetical protein
LNNKLTTTKIFLDTTICVDLNCAIPEKSENRKDIISKYHKILSSTYVKMEFKRTYLQRLSHLNNICYDAERFKDVAIQMDRMGDSYSKRLLRNTFDSIVAYFCYIDDKKVEPYKTYGEILLKSCRQYLKIAVPLAWSSFDKYDLIDQTKCFNAIEGPKIRKGNKYEVILKECKKNNKKCTIEDFFLKNKFIFKIIYLNLQSIQQLDEEQKKLKNSLREVLEDPEKITEKQICWNLGDAIIATECPTDCWLFTTNKTHFNNICNGIDRKLI